MAVTLIELRYKFVKTKEQFNFLKNRGIAVELRSKWIEIEDCETRIWMKSFMKTL